MREFPPTIEKLLAALGVNTLRLRWKLHYWEEERRKRRAAREQRAQMRRYKHCRHCGELALAEDKVCKCGHRLPSYTAYRVSRALAVDRPEFAVVSFGFLFMISAIFILEGSLDPRTLLGGTETSLAFGALHGQLLAAGQYWRLMAFGLAHFGVIHILFNSMALLQAAPRIEGEIGPWRMILTITVCQAGSALGCVVASPGALVAGASGIIFGLIGFGVAYAHRAGRMEERSFYLQWLAYGIVFSFLPGISKAAHIGGMLAGLPLGYWMGGREPRGWARQAIRVVAAACLVLWAVCAIFLVRSVAQDIRGRNGRQTSNIEHRTRNDELRITNFPNAAHAILDLRFQISGITLRNQVRGSWRAPQATIPNS